MTGDRFQFLSFPPAVTALLAFVLFCGCAHLPVPPDLPGFGASDKPETDYTIGFYVDFLTELVERLGLGTVDIAATSMGCIISSAFALEHPDRVGDIIFISPVGLPEQRSLVFRLAARRSLVSWYSTRVTRDDVARLLSQHVVSDPASATEFLDP